jgi:hypothetical protein
MSNTTTKPEEEKTLSTELQKIVEGGLYTSVDIGKFAAVHPNVLENKTFTYYCEECKKETTFMFVRIPSTYPLQFQQTNSKSWNIDHRYVKNRQDHYSFTQHYKADCQQCKVYCMDFVFNMFDDAKGAFSNNKLKKVGQYPPVSIRASKVVEKYLTKDNFELYKKALYLISLGYGVGAFAYFRRIIETEIIQIITLLSEGSFEGAEEIKKQLEEKKQGKITMQKLLDSLTEHLPPALLEIGDNPVRILFNYSSNALHGYSEEKCIETSKNIDLILKWTFQKIKEEKSTISEIRNAIKTLKAEE